MFGGLTINEHLSRAYLDAVSAVMSLPAAAPKTDVKTESKLKGRLLQEGALSLLAHEHVWGFRIRFLLFSIAP